MSDRDALLEKIRKKRLGREVKRVQNEEVAGQHGVKEDAAVEIQRVLRGGKARWAWFDNDWRSLQKQLDDLEKVDQVIRQKGQHFIPPLKVLLPLMCRCVQQRRRPAEERAQICGRLVSFVVSALRAPLDDAQRSLCFSMSEFKGSSFHLPSPFETVLRFTSSLFYAVIASKGAVGALGLAEMLDVDSWGQGKGLKELSVCRELAVEHLASVFVPPLVVRTFIGSGCAAFVNAGNTRTTSLNLWRTATMSSIGLWPGGDNSVPERLLGLVGAAAAWLRLVDGSKEASVLLEQVVSVPRIAGLLVRTQPGDATPYPWAWLLRCYAQSLEHTRGNEIYDAQEQKSMQAIDREYMLVYLSGNLWELNAKLGLPLEPLLIAQSLLIDHVEVSMLPGAPSHSVDEPKSVQGLRQQLQQLVEPSAVKLLFGRVLCLHPRHCGAAELATRLSHSANNAYQRHCIAVALHEVNPIAVEALCRIYSVLMFKARMAMRSSEAGWGPQIFSKIANMLAYMEDGGLVKVLWRFTCGFFYQQDAEKKQVWQNAACYHILHLHATMLSQLLSVMSQDELRGDGGPLNKQDLSDYVAQTTKMVARLVWHASAGTPSSPSSLAPVAASSTPCPRGPLVEALLLQSGRVLTQLQTFIGRESESQPLPVEHWHAPSEVLREFRQLVNQAARAADGVGDWEYRLGDRAEKLLRYTPQSIPFDQRVTLLRAWAQKARERSLGRPAVRMVIRRNFIFEDGLAELEKVDWRAHFQVTFVNEFGRPEQGQDAGGLFKEYWEKLAECAFNPDYGLFKATDARLLYPNPQAAQFHERVEKLFHFLGLVIGKAIFEGIVVEPNFAPFFIAKILGRHNSYYDLQSLDPSLFTNLQRLKQYEGNVTDLCCSFVATADTGEEVPLLPNGQDVPVTNENKYKYIYMLSDYKLNIEQKAASAAFLSGFQKLVDERWLRMFGEDELQQVISGAQTGDIDVEDLQKHTQYSNCSGPRDKVVVDFWNALKALTPKQRVKVLRFVTSCSRTPLLGFGHLVPPFTLHKVPIHSDKDKLPSASTCFNTLKLPTYSSSKVMKQKLEFVIEAGAGFELD